MERLKGKTAMVVGAGSIGPGWGNGKATAATFAREGAQVFCVDRNAAAAGSVDRWLVSMAARGWTQAAAGARQFRGCRRMAAVPWWKLQDIVRYFRAPDRC